MPQGAASVRRGAGAGVSSAACTPTVMTVSVNFTKRVGDWGMGWRMPFLIMILIYFWVLWSFLALNLGNLDAHMWTNTEKSSKIKVKVFF